ncbi:MAG: phosphodiester glycosidase family protein [Desulfobacterales bacterium]|nr:phosphodiester glycosidase family protein [Desulfobacterales bacterium]
MKSSFRHWLFIILISVAMACSTKDSNSDNSSTSFDENWQQLDDGLELGRFNTVNPSDASDARIHILRIDPYLFQLHLFNASATENGNKQTARKWAEKFQLISAINASMYQKDHKTSVSFMRSENHINNSYISKDQTILAFNPKNVSDPVVKMVDRECDDFNIWSNRYGTLIQSIRMISCKKENVWTPQPEKWGIAAIGIDQKDRVMFIHTRSPYTAHDFINTLLSLPIQITQAMYVEGGPEAQLYIQTDTHKFEFIGGYEPDFKGNDRMAIPIPNVIGIIKRTVSLK